MSRPSSQDWGPPTKRDGARKQFKKKSIVVLATKGKLSFAGPVKTATALAMGGASAVILSRRLSRASLNRNGTDGCQCWHGNSTAEVNCVASWTERTKADLLHFGWDETLLESFGDRMKSLTHFLDPLPLPRIIKEPPPLLLLLGSCATLAFAVTYLRHINRMDQYQDRIIGGWILVAILVGFMSDDGPIQAMTLMPWAILLALVLSSLVHRVLGLRLKAEEEEG